MQWQRGEVMGRAQRLGFGLAAAIVLGTAWAAPLSQAIRMDVLWPYYHPSVATVPAGMPIAWENPTSMAHTVTHDACGQQRPCAFHSGPVPPGETFSIPGLPPGRYAYHCALHPSMRGVLVVRDRVTHMSAVEEGSPLRLSLPAPSFP